MTHDKTKKPFNKRAFISTALFVSGLSLPLSGFMNHYYQFESLTLARHFWMSVHDVASILFVLFSILHISFNWKALMSYAKKAKEIYISKEALTAIVLVVMIIGIISSHSFHVPR